MKTDSDLDRQLRSILREELDREVGPDPYWAASPAARRVTALERRGRFRWPLRILAVAALIGTAGTAAILGGQPADPEAPPANGWIAFTVRQPASDPASGVDDDLDIWFAALDQEPRRVTGSDTDQVQELCPAFSPDGRSLAYGRFEGRGGASRDYRNAALVVADVSADGRVSVRQTVDVGDGLPPPCPVWSSDGSRIAFGVNLTSPINPTRSGNGSAVWIVTLGDGSIAVLPDLLATDLEWAPDGSVLAIVGGVQTASGAGVTDGLQDARIHLYTPSSGAIRTLDATQGTGSVTWSPDGGRIAYDGPSGLGVIEVDTGQQKSLTSPYRVNHGIGPVWSPDGRSILFQRVLGDGERHEVVLVTPGDLSDEAAVASEVVVPMVLPGADTDGSDLSLYPYRVAWSPDGRYVLSVAWARPDNGDERTYVVAVPTDPQLPAVVLFESDGAAPNSIVAMDGYDDTTFVPIQTWGSATDLPTATTESSSNQLSTVNDLLNGFLGARVTGAGAEQYLEHAQDVPLLYATSSGAPYERAEFEAVAGVAWPYGLNAFKARLFSGDTVVEQLFFVPVDLPTDGSPALSYEATSFGTEIAPTTEDGQPLARTYSYLGGEASVEAAHPWIMSNSPSVPFGRLVPQGPGVPPTTDGGQRNDWDRLFLIADPLLTATRCDAPSVADAAALAEEIRSRPELGATAPVVVSAGAAEASTMDLRIAAGTTISVASTDGGDICRTGILSPVMGSSSSYANGVTTGEATGEWMRLYLLDAPDGSSMRILAIVIVAGESTFERAVAAAAPVVDSFEFHAR